MLNLPLSVEIKDNKSDNRREENECQTEGEKRQERREASGEFIANNGVSENVNFVFMASNVWAAYADCCHKVDFKFCLPLCLSVSHSVPLALCIMRRQQQFRLLCQRFLNVIFCLHQYNLIYREMKCQSFLF